MLQNSSDRRDLMTKACLELLKIYFICLHFFFNFVFSLIYRKLTDPFILHKREGNGMALANKETKEIH